MPANVPDVLARQGSIKFPASRSPEPVEQIVQYPWWSD